MLFHGVSRFVQEDSGIIFSGFIKQPEMQKEQDSYGDAVGAETVKALEIKSVRIRMEARREAQSEAWEAILRTAGRNIDFDLDDLVALENRAQAEWVRVCKARDWKAREESVEDRAERAAEHREDARKWSGVAEDLRWRPESDGYDS